MRRDQRGLAEEACRPSGTLPCPSGSADHVLLVLPDDTLRQLGRPAGQPLHVDRSRQPATGDLVWFEVVRQGSTQRLVRRYALDDGWVTLSVPDGSTPAIMRRRGELLVLGVVDDAACAGAAAEPPGRG